MIVVVVTVVVTPCHYTARVPKAHHSGMINDLHRSQFRLPYPLYERLKSASEGSLRSLNAEIVMRLEASFAPVEDPVERLVKIMDERDARLLAELKSTVSDLLKNSVRD